MIFVTGMNHAMQELDIMLQLRKTVLVMIVLLQALMMAQEHATGMNSVMQLLVTQFRAQHVTLMAQESAAMMMVMFLQLMKFAQAIIVTLMALTMAQGSASIVNTAAETEELLLKKTALQEQS